MQIKTFTGSRWFYPWLLLVWVLVGAGLRFFRLTEEAPWADEFSTIIFSLGHSFQTVPLDRSIAVDVLLQPLQPDAVTSIGDVVRHLLTESNHPPLYFVLAHLWMGLFPTDGGIVSMWAARSLPAILGIASIPAMYALGYLAFRSRLVGHMAAAMMAVSPFGVFLAQEARHYTLAVLFVIASLCCLIVAARAIASRTPLSAKVGLFWVVVNTLGVATHYFFVLTLCAEAIALLAYKIQTSKVKIQNGTDYSLRRIYLVAAGTLAGSLVWLPIVQSNYSYELTHWIYDRKPFSSWIEPIGRVLAWLITMLVSLPMNIATIPLAVAIVFGVVTVIFVIWVLPILWRGLKLQQLPPDIRLSVKVLGNFIIGALALFFIITYSTGADLTLAPRYQFVYFPAAITLVGAALATYWNTHNSKSPFGSGHGDTAPTLHSLLPIPRKIIIIWLVGLVGGLVVAGNLGYLQTLRPDLLVNVIQNVSDSPVLIATTHKHHGQTGRMMGLAWEFKRRTRSDFLLSQETGSPQFLLAHASENPEAKNPTHTLQEMVAGLPRPLDVWLVNFHAPVELEQQNCFAASQPLPKLDSYWYRLYRCPAP